MTTNACQLAQSSCGLRSHAQGEFGLFTYIFGFGPSIILDHFSGLRVGKENKDGSI
jgi:hypothetical protein